MGYGVCKLCFNIENRWGAVETEDSSFSASIPGIVWNNKKRGAFRLPVCKTPLRPHKCRAVMLRKSCRKGRESRRTDRCAYRLRTSQRTASSWLRLLSINILTWWVYLDLVLLYHLPRQMSIGFCKKKRRGPRFGANPPFCRLFTAPSGAPAPFCGGSSRRTPLPARTRPAAPPGFAAPDTPRDWALPARRQRRWRTEPPAAH